ncbi:hypothetical protein FQN57_000387 [Myotisia sp. PD_48]|nr:hypothetical protein FQN57_000387 [Myotisia sp. PD_48]
MNAWPSDATTANIPNHDNGAFNPGTIDPSMAFLHQPQTPQDPTQFLQHQRMYNGAAARHMSPGFPNPNSVIPSKRSRPDDGFAPGGIPASRAQTPQHVPYPGYQGPANGGGGNPAHFAQPQPPTAFQQQFPQPGSSTASPSPVPQEFDPQISQRLQTASPSPFPSSSVQFPSQSSPQSDHGSHVNTPQASNSFMQGQPYPQHLAPQYSTANATGSGIHPALQAQYNQNNPNMMAGYPPQQVQSRQHLYQMHMQGQPRQMHPNNPAAAAQAAAQAANQGINPMVNPQLAAMRQAQQAAMAKPSSPEAFLRVLQKFMMSRRLALDPNPLVGGRPIILMQLYGTVMKLGGSKKVTATNSWPLVAQQLQFPALHYPTAPQEIKDHYYRNLAAYEQVWISNQQKQTTDQFPMAHPQQQHPQQPQHPQQQPPQRPLQPPAVGDPSGMASQMPPNKPLNSHSFDSQPQNIHQQHPMQQHNAVQPVSVNGHAASPQGKPQTKQHNFSQQHRSSLSRSETQSPNGHAGAFPGPPIPSDKGITSAPHSTKDFEAEPASSTAPRFQRPIEDPFQPLVLPETSLHGPIVIDEMFHLGDELMRLKPTVPRFVELGVIDIHALTLSVQSGIHAEVRMALDTLAGISCEPAVQISLDNCGDLVETLIDCAEAQLELIAEHAPEVSDVMLLSPYEELLRGCRQEIESLVDVPEFGSLEYELDRAVDRLICITTILRNFSFAESNFTILSMPFVVKFISTVIRYLGTRNMLLRTHQNTLDFMKDAVILLSNLAHAIHLPGKEEALCLLNFLLSFAPSPAPSMGSDPIMFPPYNPNIHRYLPAAVDSLAKLLARDDPNRSYYRAILTQDTTLPPYELITRVFAFSVAPIPEYSKGNVLAVVDARIPFLMQGMLVADIVAGLADRHLARLWLGSADGFAASLVHLAGLLSADRPPAAQQRHPHASRNGDPDYPGYRSTISRILSILSRLAEKCKTSRGELDLPFNILPKKENIISALASRSMDPSILRQLCEYFELAG